MTWTPTPIDSSAHGNVPNSVGGYLWRASRSTGTLAAFEVVNKATRFGATVLLARFLTLHDYGLVNVGIAISGILMVLTSLGLPDVGARDVAVDRPRTNEIVNVVVRVRVTAVVTTTAALLLGALVFHPDIITVVLGGGAIALGMSLSADWALRGQESMRSAGTANALGGTVVLLLSGVLVYITRSVAVALGVWALGELSSAYFTQRKLPVRFAHVSFASARALVRRSWSIGVSTLVMYAYYANLDTVVLSVVRSPAQAGLYSAPYRVFLAFNVIGPFAAYAFLPILARAGNAMDKVQVDRALTAAVVGLGAYGLVILGAVEMGGRALLVHLFGARFGAVQEVFVILCLGIPWYTMALPVAYGFVAQRTNRPFAAGAVLAGVVNIVLISTLIPSNGATGAAIATAASFVTAAAAWIAFSRRGREFALAATALPTLATLGALAAILVPASSLAVGLGTIVVGVAATTYTIHREIRLLGRVGAPR